MKDFEKKAKLKALSEAHKMATDMMGEGLKSAKGLKKVTVAADSEEGLEEGLELAKSKVEEMEDEDEAEETSNPFEGLEEDESEDEELLDEESIDAEIQRLIELKEKLSR